MAVSDARRLQADGGHVQVCGEAQQQHLQLLLGQVCQQAIEQLPVGEPGGHRLDVLLLFAQRVRDRHEPLGRQRRGRAATARP